MGMSAIDNVLWDLKGQIFGQPVYILLGGDRKQVSVYGSALGFSQEPDTMQAKARELKAEGYTRQKWFLNHTGIIIKTRHHGNMPQHGRKGWKSTT